MAWYSMKQGIVDSQMKDMDFSEIIEWAREESAPSLLETMLGGYDIPAPKTLHRKQNPRKRHEIDDEWIAGIRKWWKKVISGAKNYPGRPKKKYSKVGTWEELSKAADDSMAFLKTIKVNIERLKEDLYFVKGLWDQAPFQSKGMTAKYKRELKKKDPEHLTFMLDIEKNEKEQWKPTVKAVKEIEGAFKDLDEGISSIKWFKEQSHPDGIYSPGGSPTYRIFDDPEEYDRMMRSISGRVDEAIGKADKAISGRLLKALSSTVKKKGDIGGRYAHTKTEPTEDVVHIGKATLIFRDIPKDPREKSVTGSVETGLASGGARFSIDARGIRPGDRKKIISQMKKAEALLRKKGLSHVWYGEFVKLPPGTYRKAFGPGKLKKSEWAAASYSRGADMVHIYENYVNSDTLIHELGHRYWFKLLRSSERAHFKKFFGQVEFPSEYGGRDEAEEFAELFLGYVGSGRKGIKLNRDQMNRFSQFLGRKKRMESIEEATQGLKWKKPDGDGEVFSKCGRYRITPEYRGSRRVMYTVWAADGARIAGKPSYGILVPGLPGTIREAKVLAGQHYQKQESGGRQMQKTHRFIKEDKDEFDFSELVEMATGEALPDGIDEAKVSPAVKKELKARSQKLADKLVDALRKGGFGPAKLNKGRSMKGVSSYSASGKESDVRQSMSFEVGVYFSKKDIKNAPFDVEDNDDFEKKLTSSLSSAGWMTTGEKRGHYPVYKNKLDPHAQMSLIRHGSGPSELQIVVYVMGPYVNESSMPYDCPELREALESQYLRGAGFISEAKEEKGKYQAKTPLEKMIGEMVQQQSGKWLSEKQMKAIVAALNKKGITKPAKDNYDDIAREVGKALGKMESLGLHAG